MTTNYGERPGIVVDDSDQFLVVYDGCAGALRWGRREAEETRGRWAEMSGDNVTVVSVSLAAQAPSLLVENVALREQVAQLRAALASIHESASAELARLDDGVPVGRYDLRDALNVAAHALAATEAGKDGAR